MSSPNQITVKLFASLAEAQGGRDREVRLLPLLDKRLHVFGFERLRAHLSKAKFMQLVGH